VWVTAVLKPAKIRLCRLERQRLERMVAPELHAQRWQRVHVVDGGGASWLWWQSRLELVGCTMMAWHPTAWLMTMWAFRPLPMQHSYRVENSAAVTAGGGQGQVVFSTSANTSPLAMLAHVGGRYGGEEKGTGTQPAWLARFNPKVGEAGWCGAWRVDSHTAVPLRPPPPAGGGGR
jgi:hypothetical protein